MAPTSVVSAGNIAVISGFLSTKSGDTLVRSQEHAKDLKDRVIVEKTKEEKGARRSPELEAVSSSAAPDCNSEHDSDSLLKDLSPALRARVMKEWERERELAGRSSPGLDSDDTPDLSVVSSSDSTPFSIGNSSPDPTSDPLLKILSPALPSIEIPKPVFFCSIEPPSMGKQKDLDLALDRLEKEDPSLRVKTDSETNQTILSGESWNWSTFVIRGSRNLKC